jgi:hypothetical protein
VDTAYPRAQKCSPVKFRSLPHKRAIAMALFPFRNPITEATGYFGGYYDAFVQRLVLAPEYGGDGGKRIGVCANKVAPIAAFPAHWAPNAMVLYDKTQFPARYRGGVFIAFHGSWDRAPYAQGGYNVVFQTLDGDRASGQCEIFADGFAGAVKSPARAEHRPSGLAVGPDGSLYVSDDIRGRIYRIVYHGGPEGGAAKVTACPSLTAPAGGPIEIAARTRTPVRPRAIFPFLKVQRVKWLRSVSASTAAKLAERHARAAMVMAVRAPLWAPIYLARNGYGAMVAIPESRKR